MRVNRVKIRQGSLTGDTSSFDINIPMTQQPWLVDQEDIIKTKFVDVEVEKSINPIFDYEKVKFLPKMGDNNLTKAITYKLNFLNDSNSHVVPTKWSDIGMVNDDFRFRKKGFTKSFLRLEFYDSDIGTSQRLLSFITLYPKFTANDYTTNVGIPQPNNYNVDFKLGDPLLDYNANGEGFSLYYFKDEVIPTVPKFLYMKATFANAKTGKATKFMVSNNTNIGIDELAKTTIGTTNKNNIYIRYKLFRDVDGYYYEIDDEYSANSGLTIDIDKYTINLYEITAI